MATKKLGSVKLTDDVIINGIDLTTDVTGILPVANGGTNLASGTSGGVLYYSAAGVLASTGLLTDHVPLVGGGAGNPPSPLVGGLGGVDSVLTSNGVDEPAFTKIGWSYMNVNIIAAFGRVVWFAPLAESGNARDITGLINGLNTATVAAATSVIEITVTDGVNDVEPSATATLSAAGIPLGTILAGIGTATLVIQASSGGDFSVRITETAVASRYLKVRQGRGSRVFIAQQDASAAIAFA